MADIPQAESPLAMLPKPVDDGDTWLISLTDVVCFLLGFFVLMAASSVVDQKKYAEMSASISQVMGKLAPATIRMPNGVPVMDYSDVLQAVEGFIHEQHLTRFATVSLTQRGVELTANDKLLFASGKATLNPIAGQFLTRIAALMRTLPYRIAVEGHTDDLPIRSPYYPSNWELSSARASSVVRLLIAQGVAPQRLTAVGYADTRPAAPYDSDGQRLDDVRARNRRVVLILAKDTDGQ